MIPKSGVARIFVDASHRISPPIAAEGEVAADALTASREII